MVTLPLKKIVFNVNTQMRAGIIGDVVNDYRDAMKDGTVFPPVVVFFDGSTHWLADGYHRWHAASEAGIETLQCDVKQGSKREAILYACGANTCNGLRRTIEDKQRAVKTLLADPEWSQWSDGTIAEQCGVSRQMVSDWRSQLANFASSPTRKGKDGKSRKAPKRKPKKLPIAATVKPDALLDASGETIVTGDFRVESSHSDAVYTCPNCGGNKQSQDDQGRYCDTCKHPVDEPDEGDIELTPLSVAGNKTTPFPRRPSQVEVNERLLNELREQINVARDIVKKLVCDTQSESQKQFRRSIAEGLKLASRNASGWLDLMHS